jgi:hypothetical protein
MEGQIKHIEFDFHFVKEMVFAKLYDIWFITMGDQVAHGFTKSLSRRKLKNLKNNLNFVKL